VTSAKVLERALRASRRVTGTGMALCLLELSGSGLEAWANRWLD